MELRGYQRKYLRSLAHNLKPTVFIGKNNFTSGVLSSIEDSFVNNELIKIKIFNKDNHDIIINAISSKSDCDIVGSIGKILIAYKKNVDPDKRKIILPNK